MSGESDYLDGFRAGVEACTIAAIHAAFEHAAEQESREVKVVLDAGTKISEAIAALAPRQRMVSGAFKDHETEEAEAWIAWAYRGDLEVGEWPVVPLANALMRKLANESR